MNIVNVTNFDGSSTGGGTTINLGGNFTLAGSTINSTTPNLFNLVCNGSSAQTLDGGTNTISLISLTVNNSSGVSLSTANGSSNLQVGNSTGGGITMTSGSLTKNSNTITYSGNGALTYNGTSQQTSGGEFPAATNPFMITVNNSAGVLLGTDWTVNTILNMSSGTLGLNGHTLTYGASSTLMYSSSSAQTTGSELTSSGPFNLNLSNSASSGGITINSATTLSGGTLTLGGKAIYTNLSNISGYIGITYAAQVAQTTSTEFPASTDLNITINNNAGVTLDADKTMTGTLTLTNGKLVLNSPRVLTIGNSVSTTGSVAASSGVITGNGTLKRWIATGAIRGQVGFFPMGANGSPQNVTRGVTVGGTTAPGGTVSVTYNDASSVSSINFTENSQNFVNRLDANWAIAVDGGFTGSGLTLSIQESGVNGVTAAEDLNISLASSAANGSYSAPSSSGSGPTTTYFVNRSNLDQTTLPETYYISSVSNSALPVQLVSFTASSSGSNVSLSWKTATEVNNYGFNIERKVENGDWIKVSFVKGHGNSNSSKSYSFTDSPVGGIKFQYRLKQMDTNGKYEYSNVLDVNIAAPVNYAVQQNYPNPFNPTTVISYQIPVAGNVSLKVFDVLGREVATLVDAYQNIGAYNQTFSADKLGLASGIYIYRLSSGSFSQIHKMILMK